MSCNLTATWKKGATGKIIEFNNLSDENGLVDLTPYTMTLNIETLTGKSMAASQLVSKQDQVTRLGDCFHVLNSTTANITAGTYRAELKADNGSGSIDYFPTNADGTRTYITIIVQPHLG